MEPPRKEDIRDACTRIEQKDASIFAEKWKPLPIVRAMDDLEDNLKERRTQLIELANGCPITRAEWHQKLKAGGIPATEDRLTR